MNGLVKMLDTAGEIIAALEQQNAEYVATIKQLTEANKRLSERDESS